MFTFLNMCQKHFYFNIIDFYVYKWRTKSQMNRWAV